jgi:hypothetical protein
MMCNTVECGGLPSFSILPIAFRLKIFAFSLDGEDFLIHINEAKVDVLVKKEKLVYLIGKHL